MRDEGCVIMLIGWMWAAIWFALGMFAMGTHWKHVICEQGQAYYVVDEQTGKTTLVWK